MFNQSPHLLTTKNQKAFTMIELVFVIVIIGILAAVAIPRLATNRDDAEAIVVVNNLKDLVNETIASYAATGKLTKRPTTGSYYCPNEVREKFSLGCMLERTDGNEFTGGFITAIGAKKEINYSNRPEYRGCVGIQLDSFMAYDLTIKLRIGYDRATGIFDFRYDVATLAQRPECKKIVELVKKAYPENGKCGPDCHEITFGGISALSN